MVLYKLDGKLIEIESKKQYDEFSPPPNFGKGCGLATDK
jgi:hypothetical protein